MFQFFLFFCVLHHSDSYQWHNTNMKILTFFLPLSSYSKVPLHCIEFGSLNNQHNKDTHSVKMCFTSAPITHMYDLQVIRTIYNTISCSSSPDSLFGYCLMQYPVYDLFCWWWSARSDRLANRKSNKFNETSGVCVWILSLVSNIHC